MVVKNRLESVVDPLFLPESFGYRPRKSALDAVGGARQMCWDYDWVCDLDIKGFFDNLDHDLLMRAVKKHAKEKWLVLYIERWLKVPAQDEAGNLLKRTRSICGCDGIGFNCRLSVTRTISSSIAEQRGKRTWWVPK